MVGKADENSQETSSTNECQQRADENSKLEKSDESTPKNKRGRKPKAMKLLLDKNTRPLTPFCTRRSVSLDNAVYIGVEDLENLSQELSDDRRNQHSNDTLNDNNNNNKNKSPMMNPSKTSTPVNKDISTSYERASPNTSSGNDTIIKMTDTTAQHNACSNCERLQALAQGIEEENRKLRTWMTETINDLKKEVQKSMAERQCTNASHPQIQTPSNVVQLRPETQELLKSLEHLKNLRPRESRSITTENELSIVSDKSLTSYSRAAEVANTSVHRTETDSSLNTRKRRHERVKERTVRSNGRKKPDPPANPTHRRRYGTIYINEQVDRPGKLRFDELESERKIRQSRRNNIVVSGQLDEDWRNPTSIDEKLKKIFNIEPGIKSVKRFSNKVVITLNSIDVKKVIMAQKSKLKHTRIYIDDDYTPREALTQRWIEQEAENERQKGEKAYTRYMKMWAQNTWWRWDDLRGNLIIRPFRTNPQ